MATRTLAQLVLAIGLNLMVISLACFNNSKINNSSLSLKPYQTATTTDTRLNSVFKEMVEQVVICCAGVCLEMKDLDDGLFPIKTLEEAAEILLPQTPEKIKELMKFAFVKPPVKLTPNCILVDFIDASSHEFL
nr:putative alpha/beta hydrolase fold protein [Tanacetum cinerariifolium]